MKGYRSWREFVLSLMAPRIREFPHESWGSCRLLALGGLVRVDSEPRNFRLQAILSLREAPPLLERAGISRIVVEVPVGALPELVAGSTWRGGYRRDPKRDPRVSEQTHLLDARISSRHIRVSVDAVHALPADFLSLPPTNGLSDVHLRSAQARVLVPMLEYAAAPKAIRLPCWELIRSLHAPNTDLALALVTGPIGIGVGEALLWQPPDQFADLASSRSFERLSDRHFRIRLRDDLAPRSDTAVQAAMLLLDEATRRSVSGIRLSLARPIEGARLPDARLPVAGDVTLIGKFRNYDDAIVLRELVDLTWDPPFDYLDVFGAPTTRDTEGSDAPQRCERHTTVDEVSDEQPSRAGARRGHATARTGTRLWERMRRVVVPAAPSSIAEWSGVPVGHKAPLGAIGAATAGADAVPARGFALGNPPVVEPVDAGALLDVFRAQVDELESRLRELARRTGWPNVGVVLGPRGVISAAAGSPRRLEGLRGRAFASLYVAIGRWSCALVDIERRVGDSTHRHAVIAVRDAQTHRIPAIDVLQREILRVGGVVARSGVVTEDGLRLSIIAHPTLSVGTQQYGTDLVHALAAGIRRLWRKDKVGDGQ